MAWVLLGVIVGTLGALASVVAGAVGPTGDASAQVPGYNLVSLCDDPGALQAGLRSFRVDNTSGAAAPIELRNLDSGATVSGVAPEGSSFWQIQGVNGRRNTTELYVNGQLAVHKNSLNRSCAALHGTAECDPALGAVTMTWSLTNFNAVPVTVVSNNLGVGFTPNPAPAGGLGGVTATASEVVSGISEASTRTLSVTIDLGRGGALSTIDATVTVPACERPLPPDMAFTFTKTATVTTADVGATITYTYAGTNTSSIPLEVVQLVDDRLGVLLRQPEVTIVGPRESLSRSVDYVVRPTDAGTVIENNAVVTVRDPASDRTAQGIAVAEVTVEVPPGPDDTPPPPTTTTVAPTSTTAAPPAPVTTPTEPELAPGLPPTGRSSGGVACMALLAIVGGLCLVSATRKSGKETPDTTGARSSGERLKKPGPR
jgi:hypothetical protein